MGGFSIGYGISVSPRLAAFDPDALAYFTTAGITDNTAKTQINDFVVGIKDLGLWSSMVSWPLRSSQNAGTGTTAYSLGGLGTYNGTLILSPSWGANGITTNNTSQEIRLPDDPNIYNARSFLAVFTTGRTGTQALLEIQGEDAPRFYFVMGFSGSAANGYTGPRFVVTRNSTFSFNESASRAINLNSFQSATITADSSTDNVFTNGSLAVSGARSGLTAINATGPRTIRGMFYRSDNTTGAFGMLSTSKWSDAQVLSIHNLYKTTLGDGLGLP